MTDAPYLSASAVKARTPDVAAASDAEVEGLVAEFESTAERYRGVAFTPRERTTVASFSHGVALLDDPMVTELTAATDSHGVTLDQTVAIVDRFYLVAPWWPWATVTYTHGFTEPPPAVLRACCLYVRREYLAGNAPNTGNSYMAFNADIGVVERSSTADWQAGRPTGWLDVDRLLNSIQDYRHNWMA